MSVTSSPGSSDPAAETAAAVSMRHVSFRAPFVSLSSRNSLIDDLSLEIHHGETFGIMGSSGSGKTTLAYLIGGLLRPSNGLALLFGRPAVRSVQRTRGTCRRLVQIVFQNPYDSFNPNTSVASYFERSLRLRRGSEEWAMRVESAVRAVDLESDQLSKRPSKLSGGQCQRAGLAFAMASEAQILILDEPSSMLDGKTRLEIFGVLGALRSDRSRTIVIMSHDLVLLQAYCDRVAVLDQGRIIQSGTTSEVWASAGEHPATWRLVEASTTLISNTRRALSDSEPP